MNRPISPKREAYFAIVQAHGVVARELRDAARVMGDTALWRQMERVSEAVRRDVAFAASLYVS